MEYSASGLAALALAVLCLGFWVPQRMRLRQQVADSRVDDRFSTGLRVLAVADGGAGRPAASHGGPAPRPALGPAGGTGEERRMGHDDSGPRRGAVSPAARASRLAQLEQRAARARRRLLLTLLLGLATAVGWMLVAVGLVAWPVGAAPSALLLAVLAAGRVAARSARRADARWLAERRSAERRATQARALANGGPYAPRNRARVTGHAVHGSTTHTQMIPRVTVTDPGPQAAGRAPRPGADDGPGDANAGQEPAPRPRPRALEDEAPARPDAETPSAVAPSPPPVGGEPWEPVPVPLPTYVTKPPAPRQSPRPMTGATPAVSRPAARGPFPGTGNGAPSSAPARDDAPGTGARADDGQPGDQATRTAGDEPRPRTETLGLPLDEILARRRAAG
ncbi:hypothetical protein [Isoptericola sp. BMS4]|uniref:hypothetical protein n=1 Tax=Isoptericola sp. BMS4 TaxID=2527875 RepID=UPI00141F20B5|nr:hypothetical protein [Isoptericola sp. BMS4]